MVHTNFPRGRWAVVVGPTKESERYGANGRSGREVSREAVGSPGSEGGSFDPT
jgi:hypothetical protein